MSFAQSVKRELLRTRVHCRACGSAFLYGAFACSPVQEDGCLYRSSHRDTVEGLAERLVEETGVIATILDPEPAVGGKNRAYALAVEDPQDRGAVQAQFAAPLEEFLAGMRKDCCRPAFLRGVFLACGTMADPEREYHLELRPPREGQAAVLRRFCAGCGFTFHQTRRKGQELLYLKESGHIEDFLAYLGAGNSAMRLMDIKIVKEVRNNVNRITNCETANIEKTVAAAVRQVREIEQIVRLKGMEFLPDELQEAAKARLEYPDLSLGELCRVMGTGISRSGLNHRFQRLSKIAAELQEDEKGGAE